jgi:hypothetical protein
MYEECYKYKAAIEREDDGTRGIGEVFIASQYSPENIQKVHVMSSSNAQRPSTVRQLHTRNWISQIQLGSLT